MAVQVPVMPLVNPAGGPNYLAVGATDTIPVAPYGKYLVRLKNTSGSIDNYVVDDPNTPGAVGATTVQNPDVSGSVPATTGERDFLLDAVRFRDASGNINITHSAPGAQMTCIVYGPFN